MSLRTAFIVALAAAGVWQGYDSWRLRPAHPPDGPIAPDDPPRAHYDITARILAREDYHFDLLSDLIPEDLALGWGPMSDNKVLRAFEISQSVRFYSWTPRQQLTIPRQVVIEHSANTHVITAD